ncbi:MAG: response regulator transcription factor, partial [Armatimonadetes bacterium]|nr:response regulator transcription factor [Anaerolineae bacterium]
MMHTKPIRVMVVDDYEIIQVGIATMLQPYGDIVLVGQAYRGREAIGMCAAAQPDVVLM